MNFIEKMITCAPLAGANYTADSRKVHHLLKELIQGQLAEQWVRHLTCYQDGRRDVIALRCPFAGKGNASRRIAKAE